MPTQTELEFYKAFNIPKIEICTNTIPPADISKEAHFCNPHSCRNGSGGSFCIFKKEEYPEITDKQLLELLTLNARECYVYGRGMYCLRNHTIEGIKNEILKHCIENEQWSSGEKLFKYKREPKISFYHAVRKIMGVG